MYSVNLLRISWLDTLMIHGFKIALAKNTDGAVSIIRWNKARTYWHTSCITYKGGNEIIPGSRTFCNYTVEEKSTCHPIM